MLSIVYGPPPQVLRAGWEMNRRSHSAHITGVNRLPRALVRKVRAGRPPAVGVVHA